MSQAHYLYFTPDQIRLGHAPDESGRHRVGMALDYEPKDAPWLAPELRLAISMTPAEARLMAQGLERMAGAAEAAGLQ